MSHKHQSYVLLFNKTASLLLTVFLFLSPFSNISYADVLVNGDEGYITNVQSIDNISTKSLYVNSGSGAFEYKYRFAVPEGRSGMTPDLQLTYNSQCASDSQIFGYGWDFSIPSIQLMNKTGSQVMHDSTSTKYYASSLSGELVNVGNSSEYRAKVETGEFTTYLFDGDAWKAVTKNGLTYYFGTSANDREASSSDPSMVYRWMLSKVADRNGNYIDYNYTIDHGFIYPDTISYTEASTTNGLFSIEFTATTTESHTDASRGYLAMRNKAISEIEVFEGAALIKKYGLNYGKGINNSRTLLTSVVETGYENGIQITLPPTSFEYSGQELSYWETDGSVDFPEPLKSQDNGVRFGDLNGDGLTDVIRYSYFQDGVNSYEAKRVHINKGGGNWDIDVDWNWSDVRTPFLYQIEANPDKYYNFGNTLIDVNGDGKDDLVVALECVDECNYADEVFQGQNGVYVNTGAGFEKDSNWDVPNFTTWNQDHHFLSNNARTLVDVNGDGLPDIITSHPDADPTVLINSASGWVASDLYFPAPIANSAQGTVPRRDFKDVGTRIADVNGDGLVDVLYGVESHTGGQTKRVYLNNGNGWEEDLSWSLPVVFIDRSTSDLITGNNLMDINGDRLPDIVWSNYHSSNGYLAHIYLNEGNGWGSKIDFNNNYYTWYPSGGQPPFGLTSGVDAYSAGNALIDFDGDTLVDAWTLNYTDTGGVQSSGGGVVINDSDIPDLLVEITSDKGAVTTIAYDGYLATSQSNYELMGTPLVNPVVVTSKESDSDFGNVWSELYEYSGAYYYATTTDIRDRRFAGFSKVVETDDLSNKTTYYHQGNGVSTTTEENLDDEALIGRPYRTETSDLSGNLYQLIRQNYATTSLGNGRTFIAHESDVVLSYDGDGDERATAKEYSYSIEHGSLLSQIEYGEVDGNSDGTFSDTGSDKRTMVYEYATSTSGLVLPSKEMLKDNGNDTVKESRYYYDNQSLGVVTTGNLTKRQDWVSGSTFVDTKWTYNGLGLVTSVTDQRDKVTLHDYDIYDLFIASTTNAEGHSTRYEYDYASGQVATTTDPNGEVFVTSYDGFGRPLSVTEPDPQTGSAVTKSTYEYTDTAGTVRVKETNYLSGTISNSKYSYYDGLGRLIQERLEAEDSNQYAVRDFVYGDDGLLRSESLPYFGFGTARTAATSDSDLLSVYEYDAMGRSVAVGTAVGTTTTVYDQWTETITDTADNDKRLEYDAYGYLTKVTEEEGASSYDTVYDWNARGDLTKVTDANGNVRNLTYDGLSRRTSLEDLHDTADSTYGTWLFAYDATGNRSSTTDPNGQVVNYTYDDINRVLTEDYLDTDYTDVIYSYDSCTNGVTRLCSVSNESATTTYAYTPNGLTALESKTVLGTTYATGYEYDRLNNQTLIVYPDGSEVRYMYSKANKTERVEQRESGGTFAEVVKDYDYGPHGMVTYQKNGNDSETTRVYDENELYRLRSLMTTATSSYGTGGPGEELYIIEESLSLLDIPGVTEVSMPMLDEVFVAVASTTEIEVRVEAQVDNEVSGFATGTQPEVSVVVATDTVEQAATSAEPQSKSKTLNRGGDTAFLIDNMIKNEVGARGWRNYHSGRVAYLKTRTDLPTRALEQALYAQDKYEGYLLNKGYIAEPKGEIKASKVSLLERIGSWFGDLVAHLLPEQALAYLFGDEDFESCGSLPCSFDNDISWGGVTPSLDHTSRVSGEDSLKVSVSGEGSGGQETEGYDTNEIWVQAKVFIPSDMNFGSSGYMTLISLDDPNDNQVLWLNLEDWGTPHVTLGGDVLSWTNTGLDLIENAINTIEMRIKVGASTGDVDIWLNNSTEGSPDYNGSGSMNLGTDNVDGVAVGAAYVPESGYSTTYYDDIVVSDSFIGSLGSSNAAPTSPTVLLAEGVTNPASITDHTPEFSAIFNDLDTGDIATQYQLQVSLSSSFTSAYWDTGSTSLASSTSEGTRIADITYSGNTLASSTPYYWRIKFWDDEGAEGSWSTTTASFILAAGPEGGGSTTSTEYVVYDDDLNEDWENWSWDTTINLGYTGSVYEGDNALQAIFTSAYGAIDLHPSDGPIAASEFDTLHFYINGASTGGQAIYVYIADDEENEYTIVNVSDYLTGGITANTWKEVAIPLADIDADTVLIDQLIFLSETASTIYLDALSFSNATNTGSPTPTFPIFRETVQSLTYTYDSLGNLTQIIDTSDTDSSATTAYTYDDLSRLTSASTTQASTTPYTRAYTYNAIGNIMDKSDLGSYTYAETSYANPHAATLIETTSGPNVTFTYDSNGNMTSGGAWTYGWDYRNRLTSAGNGAATTSYGYDYTGNRIWKDNGTVKTYYPFGNYEVTDTGTTTKHIYVGEMLVASIEDDTPGPKVYYNHLDHLNSTRVTTDQTGYTQSVADYFPFGETRVDEQYGEFSQNRKYLGEVRDDETALNYLGSRYQSGQTAKFTSQDQASLDLGSLAWEQVYNRPLEVFLRDPQQLNTYSYARNNPIVISDPEGDIIPLAIAAVMAGLTAYDAYTTGVTLTDPNASLGEKGVAVALFASPVGEFKAGVKGISKADNIIRNAIAGRAREAAFAKTLSKQFPGSSVQREVYLRNADGTIARDAFGSARRLDFVVIKDGQVQDLYEVTSKTADKSAQIQKELNIRNSGGTYIKDRTTGDLLDVSKKQTKEKRLD